MQHVDSANFEAEVLNSEVPVIVDFWAEWCGPCRMIAPVFEDLSKEYEGKVKFVKLDVDSSPDMSEKYNVISIPTFIIFKNGQEFSRKTGALARGALKEFVDKCR